MSVRNCTKQNGAVNLLSLAVALRNDRNAEVTSEAGETGV